MKIGVFVVGGGGSGHYKGSNKPSSGTYYCGGGSGFAAFATGQVASGKSFSIVVGAGGASQTTDGSPGLDGESSSFGNLIAEGGEGGTSSSGVCSLADGGVPATTLSSSNGGGNGHYGPQSPVVQYSNSSGKMKGCPWNARNPFTGDVCLGSGGGGYISKTEGVFANSIGTGGKHPITGLGGGNCGNAVNGEDATEFGCGGGASLGANGKKSGKGGDGIVIIYRWND